MMLSLFSCQAKNVKLNEGKSYFSDFKIENDKVYIYCTLFIENKSDTEKVISLNASFEKDVENVKEQIERLKAELMKDERKNIRDLRSISQSIKEQKDRIDVFATWKE